jgi:acyl transferase domain-containing protein
LEKGQNANDHAINGSRAAYGLGDAASDLKKPKVLLLSAADEAGVQRNAKEYDTFFEKLSLESKEEQDRFLANLSYTLSNRRSDLPWKSFTVVNGFQELRQGISNSLSKPVRSSLQPSLSFVFTGQGAQWHAMAQGLTVYRAFSASLDRSHAYLHALGCKWDIIGKL